MNIFKKAGLALLITLGLSSAASAVPGYATADVNLRAGPSTAYPIVATLYAGDPVEIYGCLSGYSWCDVNWRGYRGWVSARYLQTIYESRRVYIYEAPPPIISFSFGTYWDHHYRHRHFYRDRDRYDRREIREERQDRRRVRQDRRQDRREIRQERRRERREEIQQERRREMRQERRQERRERQGRQDCPEGQVCY